MSNVAPPVTVVPPFVGGGAHSISEHFFRHHASLTGRKLSDLAAWYGCSSTMMRTALRLAEPKFHRAGQALAVPMRVHGYVVMATADERELLASYWTRLAPIRTELTRYAAGHAAVKGTASTVAFDGIMQGMESLLDDIADLVLA